MGVFERSGLTLLDGASDPDGDPVALYRVDGVIPAAWPHRVTLASGFVDVYQDGRLEASGIPGLGAPVGSFLFTVWDGRLESPAELCTLYGWPISIGQPSYGWNPAQDCGVQGDVFARAGATGGDGSAAAPFGTVAAALTAAVSLGGYREVKLDGTFREAVTTQGFHGRISRWGAARAKITGAEVLTGWTPCTAADAPDLGPIWTGTHKTTLPLSAVIGGDPLTLNLHEAGQMMAVAQLRADGYMNGGKVVPKHFFSYDRAFPKGTFVLSGAVITAIVDPANLAPPLTDAQVMNAFAMVNNSSNRVTRAAISASNMAGNRIDIGGNLTENLPHSFYNLVNLLPRMQIGEWGWKVAAGIVTVYCRPTDPANLAGGMEYSAREHCIGHHTGQAGQVRLEGLEIVQAASDSKFLGHCVGGYPGASTSARRPHPIHTDNCYIGHNLNATPGADGYGAVWYKKSNGSSTRRSTIMWTPGSFGVYYHGDDGDVATGSRHEGNLTMFTGNSPLRVYDNHDFRHLRCLYEECGYGEHPNQFNFYRDCDLCLNAWIRTRHCSGYVTWQDASRIDFAFCDIMASSDQVETSGRGVADQNRNIGLTPNLTAASHFIHNRVVPHPDRLVQDNSVLLGDSSLPNMAFHLINNVIHGGGCADKYTKNATGTEGRRAGNLYTETAFWQKPSYGWMPATGEIITTAAAAYVDPAGGDFRAKPGGSLETATPLDVSAEFAILVARYPDVNLLVDLAGNSFDPAAPGFVGPASDVTTLT